MLVSVCLITKNEEKLLRGCLESVRAIADEIVLVDTGSVDRTIEIAGEFGCRVLRHEWQEDFALARNVGIEAAHGEWIFCIDADERLGPPGDLRAMLTHASDEIGGYVIERHDIVKDPKTCKTEVNPIGIVRLFRRHSQIRYEGAVHERPGDSILAAGFQLGLATQFKLSHMVNALSQEALTRKQVRYLGLLNFELTKKPEDSWFLYYRAKTRLYLEDHEGALRDFHSVARSHKTPLFLRASACSMSAMALSELGQLDAAMISIEKSLRLVSRQSLAHYIAGEILYQRGEYKLASQQYARVRLSLSEDWSEGIHGDLYITTEKKSYKLGCCELAQGAIRNAFTHFRTGIKANLRSADCFYGMAQVFKIMNKGKMATECLKLASKYDPEWSQLAFIDNFNLNI